MAMPPREAHRHRQFPIFGSQRLTIKNGWNIRSYDRFQKEILFPKEQENIPGVHG
jgi:hypothetical protein